jgi:hypothetical protein
LVVQGQAKNNMKSLDSRPVGQIRGKSLSQVLADLAHQGKSERICIKDLLDALGDRAIGALMFVFAVPGILPVPPGVSTILGTPLIFLSVQLMLGLRPWLPAIISQRSLLRSDFQALIRRILPWLVRAERLLRPRYAVLSMPPLETVIGLLCLLLSVTLALPIPLGNTLPALAIGILALGVLEKDGLWVLAGFVAAAVAATVVSGVVFAMLQAAVFLVGQLFH